MACGGSVHATRHRTTSAPFPFVHCAPFFIWLAGPTKKTFWLSSILSSSCSKSPLSCFIPKAPCRREKRTRLSVWRRDGRDGRGTDDDVPARRPTSPRARPSSGAAAGWRDVRGGLGVTKRCTAARDPETRTEGGSNRSDASQHSHGDTHRRFHLLSSVVSLESGALVRARAGAVVAAPRGHLQTLRLARRLAPLGERGGRQRREHLRTRSGRSGGGGGSASIASINRGVIHHSSLPRLAPPRAGACAKVSRARVQTVTLHSSPFLSFGTIERTHPTRRPSPKDPSRDDARRGESEAKRTRDAARTPERATRFTADDSCASLRSAMKTWHPRCCGGLGRCEQRGTGARGSGRGAEDARRASMPARRRGA